MSIDANALLRLTIERGASDLHLNAHSRPVLRIHGKLVDVEDHPPLLPEDIVTMLRSLISAELYDEFEARRDLDFAYELSSGERFRAGVAHQRGTVAISLRAIPSQPHTFEELGLPEMCRTLASRPHGLVLVTGPTGSGKTTTLAAMVRYINETRRCHIVTIEDPIEFIHTSQQAIITQREIGSDASSFAETLRHTFRQDPDVILIGEMRDLETVSAAVTGAETGHLVLATLHTTSAPQTIDRIISMFPQGEQDLVRSQLALGLQGVITQVLLPRASGSGRVPAVEVLIASSAVRNLIREGKTYQVANTMQLGVQQGNQTMDQALQALVDRGTVTPEDALVYATNPQEFPRPGGRR